METESGEAQPRGHAARALWIAGGILLLVITALILYATFARYLFRAAPLWGEDVPRLLFVWLTFIGAGAAISLGLNIRVGLLVDNLPAGLRRCIEVTMHALVLLMLAVLFWWSFPIIHLKMNVAMTTTGWPAGLFALPLPIGCILMGWFQFRRLLRAWRGTPTRP
ncbi:MAG: TRAP transporter small permease [Alphaproteobacteria bacterium]|nr:TRAP transporter small permease [Alphaproteobacteria bacterium]